MKLRNFIPKHLITERKNQFGCVMLYFTFSEMSDLHELISPEDVMTKEEDPSFGLEDEPHTTLLYGLHEEVTLKQVENILDGYTYYTCKVSNPSLFKNEEFDVLKFDVTGDNLHETNKSLKELPHTSTYPNYHPHLTIGYIKPGKGQRYVDIINDLDETEYWLAPKYAVYSQPNGKKTKINIRID